MGVNYHVGPGNQIHTLWKSTQKVILNADPILQFQTICLLQERQRNNYGFSHYILSNPNNSNMSPAVGKHIHHNLISVKLPHILTQLSFNLQTF